MLTDIYLTHTVGGSRSPCCYYRMLMFMIACCLLVKNSLAWFPPPYDYSRGVGEETAEHPW